MISSLCRKTAIRRSAGAIAACSSRRVQTFSKLPVASSQFKGKRQVAKNEIYGDLSSAKITFVALAAAATLYTQNDEHQLNVCSCEEHKKDANKIPKKRRISTNALKRHLTLKRLEKGKSQNSLESR